MELAMQAADRTALMATLEAIQRRQVALKPRVIQVSPRAPKMTIFAQYFDHLTPFNKRKVLVVPIKAYKLVLGLPWFRTRNPETDWSQHSVLSLWTPCGSGSHGTEDSQLGQPEANIVSIETLLGTSFGDLLASEQVAGEFSLRTEDCIRLLQAKVERTHENGAYPRMLDEQVGAGAVVAAEEEPHSGILE
jgi:hypothetical protein